MVNEFISSGDRKTIIFWLSRVLSEKTQICKKLLDRINTLDYQAHNFGEMELFYQKQVIDELILDLANLEWIDPKKKINNIRKEVSADSSQT